MPLPSSRGGIHPCSAADAFHPNVHPQMTRAPRWPLASTFVAWALLALLASYALAFIWLSDIERIVSWVPDDASYYFSIARNFARGKGLSFDCSNITNGFHPLWLYVLSMLNLLISETPEVQILVFLSLQAALLTGAGWLLFSTVRRSLSSIAALTALAGYVFWVAPEAVNGMESALLVFCIAAFMYVYSQASAHGFLRGRFLGIGLALGLVVLARLDAIFFAACIFLIEISRTREPGQGRLPFMTGGFLLIVGPYLIYNYATFGHLMPISGWLKTTFPVPGWRPDFLGDPVVRWSIALAVGYLVAAGILSWRKTTERAAPRYSQCVAALCGMILLQAAYTVVFMRWAVFPWHFVLFYLLLPLVFAHSVHWLVAHPGGNRWAYRIALSMIALACIPTYARVTDMRAVHDSPLGIDWQIAARRAAIWARDHTTPSMKFAMKDSGHFAFFSDRCVVNLDGLVNNYDYQDILEKRQLNQYLVGQKVAFVVQHSIWDNDEIVAGHYERSELAYRSEKFGGVSDGVRVTREGEVYRSAPYFDGSHKSPFLIWRYLPGTR
jgi:hypothetical protein